MARGRFIALEGGEGSGKSTQAALLSEWLGARGIAHVVTREPGGTPLGEAVRAVVLQRTDLDVPPASELFLYLTSRAAFVRDVVRPALEEGKVVIADRFNLSTLAYQGYGRGLDLDDVRAAIALATGGLEPDLTLLLDLPVEEGRVRQRAARMEEDRIEREGRGFLNRVRDGYLALAASEAGVRAVPATGTPAAVHARIRDILVAEMPETFGDGAV